MVEVSLAVGLTSQELSEMLSEAVRSHREDPVSLLIDCGSDKVSLPLRMEGPCSASFFLISRDCFGRQLYPDG
jgi:hypothetical protein